MVQLYMKKIVCRPTVKNVFIPGVVSPMPLPPRRSRRKHRLRVPCSECHCPSNNPCKPRSNYHPNSKHNYHPPPHHNPLVRSKSAVMRSLCKRMRAPFTRSQTVDESVLRYYSPETSEYTVSEGFLLKPEQLTQTRGRKGRIPEIYVEDCLSVNFNKRLIDKFRAKNRRYGDIKLASSSSSPPCEPFLPRFATSHRRSRSWQDRSTRTAASARPVGFAYANLASKRKNLFSSWTSPRLDYPTIHQSSMRRSLLSSKARSFDYDIACNNDYATTTRRAHGQFGQGLLSRRSRSFEYESISANIFSDDSLQTAREKIKKNMALSDEGYGDKIPALGDQSKSYYDSNGDGKLIRDLKKRKARQKDLGTASFVIDDDYDDGNELNDCDLHHENLVARQHESQRFMYGYDSELSCGDTEIYLPHEYASRREDSSKRKYPEFLSQESWLKSPDKRTKAAGIDNVGYNPLVDASEHIYCSIDEIGKSSQCLPNYKSEIERLSRWRKSPLESSCQREPGVSYDDRSSLPPRRRTKSNDSYLNADYAVYDNWNVVDEGYDNTADFYYDNEQRKSNYADYQRQSVRCTDYTDTSWRQRDEGSREAMIATEPFYENVPYPWDSSMLAVPNLNENKRMTLSRAESTPILHSDEDYGFTRPDDNLRRINRRKRNTSCPESREVDKYIEDTSARRYYDDERTNYILQSDEEFGSVETVIDRRYTSRRGEPAYNVGSRSRTYRTHNREDSEEFLNTRHRSRRKNSCPECREEMLEMERARQRRNERRESSDSRSRHRRQNSSCPEEILNSSEEQHRVHQQQQEQYRQHQYQQEQQQQQQRQQQPSIKRNVAISDTLEYYEYSMESESQCSENCGFGPCDPRRPHDRAPRPGNANSNLFDSQTATSDTAKNPRTTTTTTYDDHHHNHHYHHHDNPSPPPPPSLAHVTKMQLRPAAKTNGDYENVVDCDPTRRRLSRIQMDDDDPHRPPRHDDDRTNNRRSSSMPECSDYASQSSSYEKPSRYPHDESDRRNGSIKRGQFTRSFSNADAPADDKVGKLHYSNTFSASSCVICISQIFLFIKHLFSPLYSLFLRSFGFH